MSEQLQEAAWYWVRKRVRMVSEKKATPGPWQVARIARGRDGQATLRLVVSRGAVDPSGFELGPRIYPPKD